MSWLDALTLARAVSAIIVSVTQACHIVENESATNRRGRRTMWPFLRKLQVRLFWNWSFIGWFGAGAFTFYPFIVFATPKDKTPASVVRHEWEHIRQAREQGAFMTIWLYVVEFFRTMWKTRGAFWKAHDENKYEEEAIAAEKTLVFTTDEKVELAKAGWP